MIDLTASELDHMGEAHMNTHPYVVTILSTGVSRSFRTKWEATDRIYRLRILWGLEAKLDLNSEAK